MLMILSSMSLTQSEELGFQPSFLHVREEMLFALL